MRRVVLAALVLAIALAAHADDVRRRPDVDVLVPVDPYEHERLHWFGKRWHHLVPGTVTINGDPYVCDLDRRRFADRDRFIAHLRIAHRVPPDQIPERIVVLDGCVHYIGD